METSTNKVQIYIIVCAIVFLALSCVLTNCYMAVLGKEAPQAFTLLTGGLVGALTSMLVKTTPSETLKTQATPTVPIGGSPPSEVVVTNKPDNPVPTEEAKL